MSAAAFATLMSSGLVLNSLRPATHAARSQPAHMWVDLAQSTTDGVCIMCDERGRNSGVCYILSQCDELLQGSLVDSDVEDKADRLWFLCSEPSSGEGCTSRQLPDSMTPSWCRDLCSIDEMYLCSMPR